MNIMYVPCIQSPSTSYVELDQIIELNIILSYKIRLIVNRFTIFVYVVNLQHMHELCIAKFYENS